MHQTFLRKFLRSTYAASASSSGRTVFALRSGFSKHIAREKRKEKEKEKKKMCEVSKLCDMYAFVDACVCVLNLFLSALF